MRLVNIESPFAGDVERNIEYAKACMRDCLARGEAPIASHLLYTQSGILRDEVPGERRLGMACGFAWNDRADATVVYSDLGITQGMRDGITRAREAGRPVEFRALNGSIPLEMALPHCGSIPGIA